MYKITTILMSEPGVFFKSETYELFCALTLYRDLYGLVLDLVIA